MSVAVVDPHQTTSREEAWKYTPVDEILARLAAAVPAADVLPPGGPVSRAAVSDRAGSFGGPRLVFVNGFHRAELSDRHDVPGVWCGARGAADPPAPPTNALQEHPAVTDLLGDDRSVTGDTALVVIDSGVQLDEPIHIVHLAAPDQRAPSVGVVSLPRTVIDVGSDCELTVVETYCGLAGPTVTNAGTPIRVADRSALDHHRIQIESPAATHVGATHVEQGADSRLRMTSVTVGGDIARNAIDVRLDGPQAETELTGLTMTARHQRHDTVVTVDHTASRCVSSQRFVGVVGDHGRGSFSGEIIVRPGAHGTDAHQSSRNLVLDPQAEADARPWLRIFADDVRCTHGATVGRLDDDALFYMRSRGISRAAARGMLVDAFIHEITDAIARPSIRAHVAAVAADAAEGIAAVGPKDRS